MQQGAVMFKFLFKKEQQIESLIYDYLTNLRTAQENFVKAIDVYFEKGLCEDFDFLIEQTHKVESKADDIRHEIETMMYAKALIPESRGDILGLLEAVDQIPSLFELILYMIQTQRLVIPEFLVLDIKELVRVSLECCDLLIKQVEGLFRKSEDIRSLVLTIDNNESHCDHIERRIITKIFDSDMESFQKIQLKEMVIQLGEISDQADRVSRRVHIISVKRRA
jgi:predicted phosphate transport protein (TIGR00153 family)